MQWADLEPAESTRLLRLLKYNSLNAHTQYALHHPRSLHSSSSGQAFNPYTIGGVEKQDERKDGAL